MSISGWRASFKNLFALAPYIVETQNERYQAILWKGNTDDECLVIFVNVVVEIEEVGQAFSFFPLFFKECLLFFRTGWPKQSILKENFNIDQYNQPHNFITRRCALMWRVLVNNSRKTNISLLKCSVESASSDFCKAP